MARSHRSSLSPSWWQTDTAEQKASQKGDAKPGSENPPPVLQEVYQVLPLLLFYSRYTRCFHSSISDKRGEQVFPKDREAYFQSQTLWQATSLAHLNCILTGKNCLRVSKEVLQLIPYLFPSEAHKCQYSQHTPMLWFLTVFLQQKFDQNSVLQILSYVFPLKGKSKEHPRSHLMFKKVSSHCH